MKRSQRRSPNLTASERVILGFCTLLVSPRRLGKISVILKASTLLRLHRALVKRKYRLLYSSRRRGNPGPTGPSRKLVDAVVEMKRRNPYFGCRKIAEKISNAFGVELNKDVVRRILTRYYRPAPGGGGPSWLSVIGQARDRLWSVDLFRTESILLKSYWVMVVMDVYTRRIVGFGVAPANLDGIRVCRMFNRAIARQAMPRLLSSDHDPLFRFHRWRANLRILEVDEIKAIPSNAPFACFRRAADRNRPARVSRSDLVLEPERPRTEARRLQGVLQPISLSHRTDRSDAGSTQRRTSATARVLRLLSLATALQGLVSDPSCCLNWNSPHTRLVRLNLPQTGRGDGHH